MEAFVDEQSSLLLLVDAVVRSKTRGNVHVFPDAGVHDEAYVRRTVPEERVDDVCPV
jgi:hypothetical protein